MCTRAALPQVVRSPFRAGFTLIELVVFIAIVGVGLAGVMAALSMATSKSADPLLIKQSAAVAEGMMEEILLKAYANPSGGFSGAASQANRAQFDDIVDYHGYDQTGVYPPTGSVYPGLENYRVQVSVGSPLAQIGDQAAVARLVQVTVTDPTGRTYVLSGYRSSY